MPTPRAACGASMRSNSRIPAIVMTMKVPPTQQRRDQQCHHVDGEDRRQHACREHPLRADPKLARRQALAPSCGCERGDRGCGAEHRPDPAEHHGIVDIAARLGRQERRRNDVAVAEHAVTGGDDKNAIRQAGPRRRCGDRPRAFDRQRLPQQHRHRRSNGAQRHPGGRANPSRRRWRPGPAGRQKRPRYPRLRRPVPTTLICRGWRGSASPTPRPRPAQRHWRGPPTIETLPRAPPGRCRPSPA